MTMARWVPGADPDELMSFILRNIGSLLGELSNQASALEDESRMIQKALRVGLTISHSLSQRIQDEYQAFTSLVSII